MRILMAVRDPLEEVTAVVVDLDFDDIIGRLDGLFPGEFVTVPHDASRWYVCNDQDALDVLFDGQHILSFDHVDLGTEIRVREPQMTLTKDSVVFEAVAGTPVESEVLWRQELIDAHRLHSLARPQSPQLPRRSV